MIVQTAAQVEAKDVKKFPYKGVLHDVTGVKISWLSKVGADPDVPEYGLRLFTVAPQGSIPIHDHFYAQTMYILTGEFTCYAYDEVTDAVKEAAPTVAGDVIFVPSMEPHGMTNTSNTDEATFLCCICNVYED